MVGSKDRLSWVERRQHWAATHPRFVLPRTNAKPQPDSCVPSWPWGSSGGGGVPGTGQWQGSILSLLWKTSNYAPLISDQSSIINFPMIHTWIVVQCPIGWSSFSFPSRNTSQPIEANWAKMKILPWRQFRFVAKSVSTGSENMEFDELEITRHQIIDPSCCSQALSYHSRHIVCYVLLLSLSLEPPVLPCDLCL